MKGWGLLRQEVERAVRDSVAEFYRVHSGDPLAGFALLTDDGLATLGSAAVSVGFLRDSSDSVRFEPVDWPFSYSPDGYEPASKVLREWSSSIGREVMIDYARLGFENLVGVLEGLRASGLFAQDVFLTVISTDPNELMEQLEMEAVPRLNDPSVVALWRAWREQFG